MIVAHAQCSVDTHVSNFLTVNDVNRLAVFTKRDDGNLFTPE